MKKHSICAEGSEVYVELKYCERCGGMWLRECGDREVYCHRCLALMDELPTPIQRRQIADSPFDTRELAKQVLRRGLYDLDGDAWMIEGGVA